MFAATYPERVSALVLAATGARFAPGGPDEPWRASVATAAADLQRIAREEWGTGATARWFAPSLVGSERARESIARWERMASNPSAVLAFVEAFGDVDMTPVLPSIAVPTLVITRADDRVFGSEHGRYLARAVPGARYFEQPGDHHIIWLGPADELVDEMQEFLTGVRGPASVDRVLSTVLFTDVVGSTSRLAEVGDERWREVLDRHDDVAARELDRFRGRLVKSTGDGLLATFDGPARAIRCAGALAERGRELGVELRAGVHTGEIEIRGDDVAGIAVHVAARIAGLAGADEILVSGTVPPLTAGSGLEFEDAGEHELKGVPGRWPVSRVLGSAVGSRS
jgi:class 3 adenylate cyclase